MGYPALDGDLAVLAGLLRTLSCSPLRRICSLRSCWPRLSGLCGADGGQLCRRAGACLLWQNASFGGLPGGHDRLLAVKLRGRPAGSHLCGLWRAGLCSVRSCCVCAW